MQCPSNNQEEVTEMKSQLQFMSKFAVPTLLMVMMAGCASVSDLEKVQNQVNEVRITANSANATAMEAKSVANEARSTANEARNTANEALASSSSAKQFSSDASGFAAAAVKSSEAAVGVAVQAQKAVNDFTVAIPWMRLDPATGRFVMQWIVWPSMTEYTGAPPAPAPAAAPAPAPAPEAAPSGK
jgi:murein lipoprotein